LHSAVSKSFLCLALWSGKNAIVGAFWTTGSLQSLTGVPRSLIGLDINADLVYAPELIEHLGNPLKCLECSAAASRRDGPIVIETPNRIDIDTIVEALVTAARTLLESIPDG
jgi:hypothetical protein